jgi:hypothetical protein
MLRMEGQYMVGSIWLSERPRAKRRHAECVMMPAAPAARGPLIA